MDSEKRYRAKIYGVVQGVGFRWFVQREARKKGIKGYVKNLGDGSVEVCAQGEPKNIQNFIDILKEGPPMSIVSKVEIEQIEPTDEFKDFEIRF
ncbi:acylphosphatase [bacterium]|nr:MAG: acylphosphatase [bacterium]